MISVGSMVQIHPDPPLADWSVRGERARQVRGHGAIAQLGERLLCKQEVTGSIPVGSTSAVGCESTRQKAEESEGRAFVLFWLLRKLD